MTTDASPASSSPHRDAASSSVEVLYDGELVDEGACRGDRSSIRALIARVSRRPGTAVPPAASAPEVWDRAMEGRGDSAPGQPPTVSVRNSEAADAPEARDEAVTWRASAWAMGRGTLYVVHNVEENWTVTAWSMDELSRHLLKAGRDAESRLAS